MEKFKKIIKTIFNKYTITLAIFLFFLFMGEKHNIILRNEYKQQIKALEAEIDTYKEKTESYRKEIELLRSDSANLERFAREKYKMKNPDEDVYTVVTDE